MIHDRLLEVDTNRSLIHGAVAEPLPSVNAVDKGTVRNIAEGKQIYLHLHITEAGAGTDVVLFGVAESDSGTLAGGGSIFHALTELEVVTALTLDRRIVIPVPQRILVTPLRYMGVSYFYQGLGTVTAGMVTARFGTEPTAHRTYPNGV